ncbi:nuclear factor erythroid 2-related factor 3 [Ahaetulla prasina]|uniref:nuclear factor erythroid 2-related factor 3 n=1 Tax=Ahaetulla prasina TaxID=499056 RepID=UPI00264917AF|nr:nuclear factor erythroid 2-related factor 3 [Ahaetulla prasina]
MCTEVDRQETAEGEDATAATAALRLAFPLGQLPHARPTPVSNRLQESRMKTPNGGWRHTSEEDWLQDTLLFSLALVAFRGKLPSGMPFFSHEEDTKLLGECLWLRGVQAPGTLSFPSTRVVPWLAQEDKAPAPPTSDAADGGSRLCREEREFFLAAEGQSQWLQPPQETLEAGVASPDPGEKKRDFNPKVLDLKGRQEYLEYCYLLPKENEHLETQEDEKQERDKSEQADWKERQNLTSISLEQASSRDVNLTNFHQSPIDLAQAISHDVSLHDATVMGSDYANVTDMENLPGLNISPTNETMLELFANDHCCTSLTHQDFFFSLNENGYEKIHFTPLTTEGNFDFAETCLFEERDSDSGLSLDLNYSNASFVFSCNKDASFGTSDDSKAVGDSCLQCCHTEYQSNYDHGTKSLVGIFHDHTYNQDLQQLTFPESEDYFRLPEESKRTENESDTNLNDEYRAKALRIPFSVKDIVTLPVESFNSMLSNYYLTDNQLSLIRDIRRRGKNKVAAQNCRKRKLDAIMNLKDEVYHLQMQMGRLQKQKAQYKRSIRNIKQKLNDLCWNFFSKLRDNQGTINTSQCAFQCCGNGTTLILPKKEIDQEPPN